MLLKYNNYKEIKEPIESINIKNRDTARNIKFTLEKNGNIIDSNTYYNFEMIKREEELEEERKNGTNFIDWLVFKIHGLSSNHSQDWILALFWILSFTFMMLINKNINCMLSNNLEYFISGLFIYFLMINLSLYTLNKKINKFYLILVFYIIYAFLSKDYILKDYSNILNPFSIMSGKEELTFAILIYKIIIGYLIYQLIISIRQNTRRK